jgi:hypothetical protein
MTKDNITSLPGVAPGGLDPNAEINRLARLPRLAYEQERRRAAKRLRIRVSVLDKHVDLSRLLRAGRTVLTTPDGRYFVRGG